MAGVNQVIMLSLSMVVIAGLAGAGGLGEPVVPGLSQLDVGISFVGGVGIVVIAIMFDRITRAMAKQDGGERPRSFRAVRGSGRTPPRERYDRNCPNGLRFGYIQVSGAKRCRKRRNLIRQWRTDVSSWRISEMWQIKEG